MIHLSAGSAALAVDLEHGGRIASLAVDGVELLRTAPKDGEQIPEDTAWGLFVMAPWAGRVRQGRFDAGGEVHQLALTDPPHAIHGTAVWRPWEVVEVEGGEALLACDLQPGWPWPGQVRHHLRLAGDHLALRLEVSSGGPSFPASCGWHPWWAGATAELAAGQMWERDADGIPTGVLVPAPADGPFDDCFTDVRRSPVVRWPAGPVVTLESTCEHWVLFTEPEDAVCVEPQTGPPDALTLGPATVTAVAPLVAELVLRWGAP